ncbi:autotransporter domain-containing protein [Pelagibacterium lentulum]|uniref:Autotransporter domain-containing protein n=1 Tax=Pelagibacterium lentulum TaxID=2029865 RepID=A0A916R6Q0_9HYPH|nr:autotransporter domain-containing protein [Pelagibacterium lentulum]GGA41680.1 hypothetical protein GCM10011499_09140 [Pelagibacterium lentulum]
MRSFVAAALSSASQTTDTTFTTIGLRAEHNLTLGAMPATLSGTIGWRHGIGDTAPTATHGFSAGDAFTVTGSQVARETLVLEAGFDLELSETAVFGLSYHGQIAADAQDHGFKANLAIRF